MRQGLRRAFDIQRGVHDAGQVAQVGQALGKGIFVNLAPVSGGLQDQQRQRGQLAGEGLGRGDADFDACQDWQGQIALARNGRLGHVHDGQDPVGLAHHVAQGSKGVGGFTGLADEQRHGAAGDGRFAVAEFGRDVDFHRDACDLFEPVFRDHTGVEGRAAGDQRQTLDLGKVDAGLGQGNFGASGVDVMGKGPLQHGGLLGDFLGHKVLVTGLVDGGRACLDLFARAVNLFASGIADLNAGAGHDGPVAFVQIGDRVSHWGQRDGVRADEVFAVPVADRQRAAFAGGDQQVVFTVEQKAQRIGTVQLGDGRGSRLAGGLPLIKVILCQQGDGFRVGVGLIADAVAC